MQVRTWTMIAVVGICCAALPLSAEIPRTNDGKPDFSGTYDITSLTRMDRDPDLGERMTYTALEVEELKRLAHSRVDEALAPSDPDRERLKALEGEARDRGVDSSGTYTPGSYDWYWFDCGGQYCDYYQVDGEYRSSDHHRSAERPQTGNLRGRRGASSDLEALLQGQVSGRGLVARRRRRPVRQPGEPCPSATAASTCR